MIKNHFIESSNVYLEDKERYFNDNSRPRKVKEYRSSELIVKEIPKLLQNKSKISQSQYLFKGSIGNSNVADVPWIGIFDKDITKSAQSGYYIVYLFQTNMKGVYLSLNQGWNQYKNSFGTANGREQIKTNVNHCHKMLRSIVYYDTKNIKLYGKSDLGKGYELGNICSKYYAFDNFPEEDELIDDLRNFIGLYRELKGLVGADIIDISGKVNEDVFQEEVQRGKRKELPIGTINKKEKKSIINNSWARDPNMSFTALDDANFKCENNENHKTFISAKSGHQFVEAHHLIPMKYQDNFEMSIDIPENIISLCPNCHKAFHNSIDEVKFALIKDFYRKRINLLEQRGISIEEDELIEYYNNANK